MIPLLLTVYLCFILSAESNIYRNNAIKWCRYISTTKEPDVIIYNRLGKCGSETMKYVIDKQANSSIHIKPLHTNKHYWSVDYSTNDKIRQQLTLEIYNTIHSSNNSTNTNNFTSNSASTNQVIVDGHWRFYSFNTKYLDSSTVPINLLQNHTIEHIQLVTGH